MKVDRNNIDCQSYSCFCKVGISECMKCKKGKVIVVCPSCGKEHTITCQFMRIDCSCGAGFLPCYEVSYFINEDLVDDSGFKQNTKDVEA